MKNFFNFIVNPNFILIALVFSALVVISSCDKDDPVVVEDPIASFQFEVSADNFLEVSFTNFSQNAISYQWDFGDGNTSSEENPVHVYSAEGTYNVQLTATGEESKTATKTESISISDPNKELALLAGSDKKTWKLFREGVCMSLGPDATNPAQWWAGLENDGARPCMYEHEFTFYRNGKFEFDDNGMFWAEYGVFNNVAECTQNNTPESCIEATAANMVNACGDDVSKWLSGTHEYEYNPVTGELTLTGEGAWIGIPKLGTTGETLVPLSSVSTKISIEQYTGYDIMKVEFIYDGAYWPIYYVSYSDPSLEPELIYEEQPWGEDLPDISPDELFRGFASAESSDFILLDTINSGSLITYGVDDPAGGVTKVGKFERVASQYQELQFQTSPTKNDINFQNLTTVSLEVYLPSTNDYSTTLTKNVFIGIGDRSATEQWWTDHMEYSKNGTNLPLDQWVTISYNLDSPDYIANPDNGSSPYDRTNYDMIYISFGGGGHDVPGTIYVKNLRFK